MPVRFPEREPKLASIRHRNSSILPTLVGKARARRLSERIFPLHSTSLPYRVAAAARQDPARLYVFDMLADDETDLRRLPLKERKDILRAIFDTISKLVYATGIVGAGAWVFSQVQARDLEGMIAKRLDSTYQRGRSRDWIKIKSTTYSRPSCPWLRSALITPVCNTYFVLRSRPALHTHWRYEYLQCSLLFAVGFSLAVCEWIPKKPKGRPYRL